MKWAKCNLGATSEFEYGDYYMWASVTPNTNDVCDLEHTPYHEGSRQDTGWTKYHPSVDTKTVLDPEDDAAYVATGGKAHIPTILEWQELKGNTNQEWVTDYNGIGVNGIIFRSKIDMDKYIFIPAAGCRMSSEVKYQGIEGEIWSSLLVSSNPYGALDFIINSQGSGFSVDPRSFGLTVRPVSE